VFVRYLVDGQAPDVPMPAWRCSNAPGNKTDSAEGLHRHNRAEKTHITGETDAAPANRSSSSAACANTPAPIPWRPDASIR
jgi:hypothetical protein